MLLYAEENPQTIQDKAQVCFACHSAQGLGLSPEWPNLGGQHKKYLLKQLIDIKQNTERTVPVMSALMANLNQQDIDDLATYYAKMPVAQGTSPEKFLRRGEQLYRGGDFNKHITACIACHGPKGTGNGEAGFPSLSGQHAAYTVMQLHAFKDRKRSNDLNHIMQDISSRMDTEDMEAVAHYIEGLY